MGQVFDFWVLAIMLLYQLGEPAEVFAAPRCPWMATLDGLAADPHQQYADQGVHHHVSRRLVAGVLLLQARKQAQSAASDQKLADLQAMLANSSPDTSMQARLIGPGDGATIRRRLLEGDAPGHEWPLCAGALLVGSLESLGFVRELVGL